MYINTEGLKDIVLKNINMCKEYLQQANQKLLAIECPDHIKGKVKDLSNNIVEICKGLEEFGPNINKTVDEFEEIEFENKQMALEIANFKIPEINLSALSNINNLDFSKINEGINLSSITNVSLSGFNIGNGIDLFNTGAFNLNNADITSKFSSDFLSDISFNTESLLSKDTFSIMDGISGLGSFVNNNMVFANTGSFNLANIETDWKDFNVNSVLCNSNFAYNNFENLYTIDMKNSYGDMHFSSENIQNVYGNMYLSEQFNNVLKQNIMSQGKFGEIDSDFMTNIGFDVGITAGLIISGNKIDVDAIQNLMMDDINSSNKQLQSMFENGDISLEQMQEIQNRRQSLVNNATNTINGLINNANAKNINGLDSNNNKNINVLDLNNNNINDFEIDNNGNDINNNSNNSIKNIINSVGSNFKNLFNNTNMKSTFSSMGLGIMGMGVGGMTKNTSNNSKNISTDEKNEMIKELCKLFNDTNDGKIITLLNSSFYNRVIENKNDSAFLILNRMIELKKENPSLKINNIGKKDTNWNETKNIIGISDVDLQEERADKLFSTIGNAGFSIVLKNEVPKKWDGIVSKIKTDKQSYFKTEDLKSFDKLIADFTNLKSLGDTQNLNKIKDDYGVRFYNVLEETFSRIFE